MQESWRTAIARKTPSLPLRKILSLYEFPKTAVILDFGCGKGRDLQYLLLELGYDAYGYDPYFQPIKPSNAFDIVLCTYVLNSREKEAEAGIIEEIKSFCRPKGEIYITVRSDLKSDTKTQRFVECPEGFEIRIKTKTFLTYYKVIS